MDTTAAPSAPPDIPPDVAALRETALRYKAFFEQGPDGVVVLDPATARPIEFNDQVCRQLGYSREEFARLSLVDIEAAETLAETRARIATVLREGKADFDTRQRTKQGEIRDVHVTAQVLGAGGRAYYHCIWRDITWRKQAEVALRESQRKFQSIAEHLTDLVVVLGGDSVVSYASPMSHSLLGFAPEELVGRPIADVLHETSVTAAVAALEGTLRQGTVIRGLGLRMRRKDASTFLAEFDGTRHPVDGRPGTLLTIRDITERRRAEEQLEALKCSIDQAPIAIYWLAPDGGITYVNEAGCRAVGYTLEELARMTVADVNPRATPARWAEVWHTLERQGFTRLESEHRRKDGSAFPVELVTAYFSYGGQASCIGFATDLTERRRVDAEREALQVQLLQAQKMESIGRLAGGVAHDFNNMLSVILGHLELAMAEVDPASPLGGDLAEIQAAAARSADLTRQLLAFARRQTVTPKVLDLNATIDGLLKMLRRLMGEGITLAWTPAPALWPVRMDPSQVSQILANLAVNARDAIDGVGTLAIATRNVTVDARAEGAREDRPAGDYVVLSAEDTGSGMTPEVVSHLFEPFFTTKGPSEGTGLGLATVYGIVHQNGGFIDVRSEPGSGTRFDIGLPRHAGRPSEADTPAAPETPGRETILLVEDEPGILTIGRRMLERLGYRVLTAGTPVEAVDLAGRYPGTIDLLVSDVVMPEMNGRDLAKRLLSIFPDMRRLFMSGYTADVIAHHGVLEDGVHFLQKPFTAASLSARVREALE